jgi:hypothetical protein
MKATVTTAAKRAILIVTLFMGFQVQFLMANPPSVSHPVNNSIDLSALAPVTPREATFDDIVPEKAPSMVSIAPSTPVEATFDDYDSSTEISLELLREVAPLTPAEADFNDDMPDPDLNTYTVKFTVPAEAIFSDL